MTAIEAGAIGFVVMVFFMLLGLPIAAVMMLLALGGGMIVFGWRFVDSSASVLWGTMNENTLTAIPLFILLGELLLRSGMADRIYQVFAAWFGRLPGGLLHTNIGCCALFAATSGSSVATAATIGTVALPSLNRHGYPVHASLGSIAAGGTLGILIPPSVNMIIYASMTNQPIGTLFLAAAIPGLVLTVLFSLWIAVSSRSEQRASHEFVPMRERLRLLRYLLEPAVVFGIVMSSIYLGIATATESAALGVIVAFLFVVANGKMSGRLLLSVFLSSARTTGMILFIVCAAFVLNLALSLTGLGQAMTSWVTGFGLSPTLLLGILVLFYLVIGMFMDALSMMVATIPLAYPVVTAAGIDPVWFGVFIVLMCELALITPPVGMNLFVVQGIRPDDGGIADVFRGVVPYAAVMLIFAAILIAVPSLATWLPGLMFGR